MASEPSQYDPSYREQDIDMTLDDHENRISRLEKAAWVGFGYALASGADVAAQLTQFI